MKIGTYAGDTAPSCIAYNETGVLSVQLPALPDYANTRMLCLFVQIFDDADAVTVFNITTCVNMTISVDILPDIIGDLIAQSPDSAIISNVFNYKEDPVTSLNYVIALASLLNYKAAIGLNENVRYKINFTL